MSLDVYNMTGLSLYRPAQEDMTVSVAANLVKSETPAQLTGIIQKIRTGPMVRNFEFSSPEGEQYWSPLISSMNLSY